MSNIGSERREIEAVVAHDGAGVVLADEQRLRRDLHPGACSIGHFEGEFEWDGLDAFVAGVKSCFEPAARPVPRWAILEVEIAGDTAVARVEDDYVGYRFIDTLTLSRQGGRRQIVAKIFWVAGKA